MKIIFATGNKHKLEEVQAVLGGGFDIVSPASIGITDDIPETCDTLEGNARQKSRFLYDRTGENCFADDTGLEVEALGGAPGVYSARYAGPGNDSQANMELLLRNLEGVDNRKARFRTVISLILDDREYFFEGTVSGRIITEPQGEKGFGYDPIFIPDGESRTFAQMDAESKNRISHRGRAVSRLAEFLKAEKQ